VQQCEECLKKDRIIRILNDQSVNYRHDAGLWKKHLFHVHDGIKKILDAAKDLRWYPSDYRTRGDTGDSKQDIAWAQVQTETHTSVHDPKTQVEIDMEREFSSR